MKTARKHPAWLDAAFVLLWVLVLCSGLGFKASARFLGWPNWSGSSRKLGENRRLSEFPRLRGLPAREWGGSIDAWYRDQFAWRAQLVLAYRYVHLHWLGSRIGTQVPGRGGWVFLRDDDWAEIDDYLGALELTPEELDGWRTQLEGRVAWAEAHGFAYVEFVTPVKARLHPEKMMPWLAAHRGINMTDQVKGVLAGSPARGHVVFLEDELAGAGWRGEEIFYEDNHHMNARGTWLQFAVVNDVLRRATGRPLAPIPPWFGGEPPSGVAAGEVPGCYERDRRLVVREPGQHIVDTDLFECLGTPGGRRNARSFRIANDAAEPGAIHAFLTHDSFLRYTLSSWNNPGEEPRLPLGNGIRVADSVMWGRFTTPRLETLAGRFVDRPDVLLEQFPGIKLNYGIAPDDTMRRAAAWGRGTPLPESASVAPGTPVLALVTLRGVRESTAIRLLPADASGDAAPLAEFSVEPGPVRALFSAPFPLPDGGVRVIAAPAPDAPPELLLRLPSAP